MKRRYSIGLAVAAAAVALIAWQAVDSRAAADRIDPPVLDAEDRTDPVEAVMTRSSTVEPVPAIADDDNTPMVRMRDGTELPALNGVTDTSQIKWSAARSRTPVVGVLRGNGHDSYLHEDGSQSATVPVKNLVTGEVETGSIVVRPIDPGDVRVLERGLPAPAHTLEGFRVPPK